MKRALFCAIALALATGAMAAEKSPQPKAMKLGDAQMSRIVAGNHTTINLPCNTGTCGYKPDGPSVPQATGNNGFYQGREGSGLSQGRGAY